MPQGSIDTQPAAAGSPPVCEDITVLVPTLGRPVLRRCLEGIARGTVWPARILVVDQGRRPDVEALCRELHGLGMNVAYVPSTLTGKSAGLNQGFALLDTRFVAITDDDCIADADWVERMTAWLRREPHAIITGRVEAGEGEVVLAVETSREHSVQYRPRLQFDRMVGGNMGMSSDVIRRVGGFEEDLCMRNAEDPEYAYRALRAGVPIIYAPDVALVHLGWREEHERTAQYESYAHSHGGFYGRYLRRGDLFIAARACFHLARALKRWVMGTLRGDVDAARFGRAYVFGLLPGIIAGWRSVRQ